MKLIHISKIAHLYITKRGDHWCGNGGSAADAQHLACELVSKFYMDRKALRSIALTTNTSIMSAVSNDFSYECIFERQVEALADKGDVLVGITTSGTSKNIINALKAGNEKRSNNNCTNRRKHIGNSRLH